MPHVPIAVSDKFLGKSKQGLYGDLMMELDWSVGEIIKSLEANNILENTLVIFTMIMDVVKFWKSCGFYWWIT